ncbi:MAG: MATE family efflux transporter, partial [Gammaproteobacteria bacterium]
MSHSRDTSISHRKVWALAGPIMLSNVSVPLVGAVDTAVVGRLPEPQAIGAVALGALIFSFLFWGFGFLRMGTTGFIARAFGA